ncbi:hypothetical protein Glove_26g109 [Diversispora epigaea]|uniref:Calreticulin n=1 Tax=Diversispora epigaea TaxID=1348612 RepID=A0A397JPT4_9GLOM|nr:hypothetical protein Glove_26g109 [Diversispora epigaea]
MPLDFCHVSCYFVLICYKNFESRKLINFEFYKKFSSLIKMKKSTIILATSLLAISSLVSADIYLKETFTDADWEKRWIYPEESDNLGKFKVSAGEFYADEIESRGLQTSQDAKFYAISAKLDNTIDNSDKDLVVQFSVKHEQLIDCGGGYVKLMPPTFDASKFNGDSIYNIMFGPDICAPVQHVHVILNHKGENKPRKKLIVAPADQLTHLYTLILKPDQTYKVLIDNKEEASGKLEDDFDLLLPREIEDPNAKKPEDWVELAEIPDPSDTKPLDWVDGPSTIPDPDAKRSEDWDDEMDGDWEPPQIPNPDFKGEWKQKIIPNPDYKGKWTPPLIPNPEFKPEPLIHAYNTAYIGFDLWQVKSGSIFDNILITDDVESAKAFAEETFVKFREIEKEVKRNLDDQENEKIGKSSPPESPGGLKFEEVDDDDDIIDMDVTLDKEGKVLVTEPDPKNDLPPIVEQNKDNIKVRDEKDEETPSDSASSVSEETPSPSASSQTKQDKDEFDKLFEDLEAEIELPKRDEL